MDACAYGRLGMQRGLLQPAMTPCPAAVDTFASVRGALHAAMPVSGPPGGGGVGRCLVVRLSPWPAQAMTQLLQLEEGRLVQAGIQRLVILSPFAVSNAVRQVLVCGAVRMPIRIVDARCPMMWLRRVVLAQGTLLQEGRDERLPHMPAMVLSTPERRVLLTTLQEIPIHRQALRQHRNHKTLYAQRKNALKKLRATGLAGLLRRFAVM
ncbi:hypothetical protein ACUNIZ_25845 [Serratia sp. IR-2025]